ncbi:MAG: tetratricopeptide repeat protein, partial [Phycisphaerae bacterium]
MSSSESKKSTPAEEIPLIEAALRDVELSGSHAFAPSSFKGSQSFPGYRVLREVRRGAQGMVYEAIQEATGRKVAIKVIFGAALASRRARFEREVQILARLKHANIVAIHDSTLTDDRAYFVMDFIEGCCLDEHILAVRPSIRSIVTLFAEIGEALAAAHLQGVIHRDLKPSNIRIDTDGIPRVLDFGLAKLMDDESSLTPSGYPAVTETGQFVGSLPWASPEQADSSIGVLDIRTDVYSIGVLMYHALTGNFPYTVVGSLRDVAESICRVDAKRPSSFNSAVNDEVDMIVLKCLEKDRGRRYQSAGELSRDLRRFLAGEPIEAKRASSWYMLRKTIGRHRVPVGAGACLLVMLIGFSIWISLLYRQAQAQHQITIDALASEATARRAAERESQKASRVRDFLFDMIQQAHPFAAEENVTLDDALRSATAKLEAEELDEPHVEAGIRHALSVSYLGLGNYDAAESQITRAIALQSRETEADRIDSLRMQGVRGRVLMLQDELDEAMEVTTATLASLRASVGESHIDTLRAEADLGMLLHARGQLEDSDSHMTELLARLRDVVGDDDPTTLAVMENLADIKRDRSQFEDSERLFLEAYDHYVRKFGENHPSSLNAVNQLAMAYHDQNKLGEAETHYRKALDALRVILGDEHPGTLSAMNNLGDLLRQIGKLDDAGSLLEEAVGVRERIHGPDHVNTLTSLSNLALVRNAEKRFDDAESMLRRVAETRERQVGPDHPHTLIAMSNLVGTLRARGDKEASTALMRRVLQGRIRSLGEGNLKTIATMRNLSTYTAELGYDEEARGHAERAWGLAVEHLGADSYLTHAFQMHYGRI